MLIRTVTFQRTHNCGAAMQAYALMKYLQSLGNRVEILDYRPDWLYDCNKPLKTFLNNPSVKNLLLMPFVMLSTFKFFAFVRDCCCVTAPVYCKDGIKKLSACDMYVAGSDQIWNPRLTKGLDDVYLLNFPTEGKKIAYSASCGLDNLADDIMLPIVQAVHSFNGVAVREHYLENKLHEYGVEKAICVLDPVFLLNKEEYRKIAIPAKHKKYLLLYTMAARSPQFLKFAKRLAEHYGLMILDTGSIRKKWPADCVEWNYGPREWLGLIDGADFVLTNSFHGTALSIVFRKNVYVMTAGDVSSRLHSVLSDFGMQDRFVKNDEVDTVEITETDYSRYEDNIQKHIEKSKNFLKEHCCEKN